MFWSQVPRPFTGDRSPSSLVFIFQRDVSSVPGKDIPGMQNEQEVYFFKKGLHTSQSTRENIYSFRFPKGNTKENREFSFPLAQGKI